MGRPPKPIEQHIAEGTYRKDRHGNKGINGLEYLEVLEPPEDLPEPAVEKWNEVVPTLLKHCLITKLDIPEIENAFNYYGVAQESLNYIYKNYPDIVSYLATINPHTCVNLYNEYKQSMKLYNEIMHKFGASPVERAKITIVEREKPEEDILLELMGNG